MMNFWLSCVVVGCIFVMFGLCFIFFHFISQVKNSAHYMKPETYKLKKIVHGDGLIRYYLDNGLIQPTELQANNDDDARILFNKQCSDDVNYVNSKKVITEECLK